jgi:hypothetical protein
MERQAALRTAVKASRWPTSGAARVLESSGDFDISPLKAVAAALHGLTVTRPSVYEDRGLMTLG